MCEDLEVSESDMATNTDVKRLHERIDTTLEKIEKSNRVVAEKLVELHTDIKVIKEAGKRRDTACLAHHKRTHEIDVSIRGNGKEGVLVRLAGVEQRDAGKDKFAYLIIGALLSGILALIVAGVIKLL